MIVLDNERYYHYKIKEHLCIILCKGILFQPKNQLILLQILLILEKSLRNRVVFGKQLSVLPRKQYDVGYFTNIFFVVPSFMRMMLIPR